MPRFKDSNNRQNMILPVNLSEQLIPGTFEHTSCIVIDKLDLSKLENKYNNDEVGAKAYHPAVLLKIIINAYAKGITTSRGIEELCNENITFMAISGDTRPDHSTIADFVTSMQNEISDIFVDILVICGQCDLIGGEVFALDGCKLSSNSGKEWSGTFKELENKKKKLKKTLETIIARHKESDKIEVKEKLIKSKKRIQDKIDKITDFVLRKKPKMGSRGREIKSNITDNESAKMHSPHGMIQGYNGMSLADNKHQVVIHADAFGNVSESEYMPAVLDEACENLKMSKRKNFSMVGKTFLADANYFSEKNCEYLFENKIDGYIPDKGFRKRDPRFPEKQEESRKRNKYIIEDFTYNKEKECYFCARDRELRLTQKNKKHHEYRGDIYEAKVEDCKNCIDQHKCLKRPSKRRTLFIIKKILNRTYSSKMVKKIDTEKGRDIYSQRMGIVEPVFANITYHKKMNRFLLRGRSKVRIQWMLYNIVHNIGKIARYGNLEAVKC